MLSCRRLLAGLLNQMESSAAFPVGGLPPGASFGDSLGSEPFVPESVFLLQPDGTADPFYQIGLISLPALGGAEVPSPVPVILITRVQGKVLAAIPFSFWHRSVARRKLPSQSFSKPASVSVGAVLDVDRENPLDGTFIKIWIGLLGEDLLQCLDFLQVQPFELEHAFPTELDLPDHVPLAEALQSVADEKFSFMTAESGDLSAGGADQSQRIARVEEALIEVKSTLQHLALGRAASSSLGAAPKAQPRVKFAASTQIPSENPIAGLDPHVVQSALRAGVSQGQLEELGRMLAGRKPDLADVARPSALRKTPRLDVLGESDEEAELSAPSAPKLTQAELDNPVQASLQKLTSILENLTSPTKKPRSLQDTLDDSVGHAEVSSTSSSGTHSRRHAAVLQTLRKAMRDCPEELYSVLEKNMLHDCGAPEIGPGLGIMTATFRGWAEHRSRVPNIQGTVRTLWAICGALDALRQNRVAEAKARLSLLIAAIDQVSYDKGSWLLGAEVLLEDGPPFGSFTKHQPPEVYEVHHSRLLPAQWAEAMMFRIRELDDFAEKRAKLGKRQPAPEASVNPAPSKIERPKPKAKGKGKGKSDAPEESNPPAASN